ncbi:hypothetical protein ACFQVD_15480 [Streptosporangium amethystogenes subsp. fukuiense]|uniref:Uncharacterized protein n=1 Tax=Streptosporangium amethystogenes subsp. fukuiense TaxID=698418 RepID=A0ABW2SYT7_9ACTN
MLCLEGVHGIPTQWWFTCLDIEGGAKSGKAGRVGVISIHAANGYHHSQTKRIDEFLVRKSSVVLTEETAAALRVKGVIVKVEHRDIDKPVLPSAPRGDALAVLCGQLRTRHQRAPSLNMVT